MEKLSTELRLAILARLEGNCNCCVGPYRSYNHFNRLTNYATISKQWQQAVETYTFRTLCISSRELLSGRAASILTPPRLSNVQTVKVSLFLELPDLVAEGKLDGENLEPYAHRIFTRTVKALFSVLQLVPSRAGRGIALTVEVEPTGYWGGPHSCPRGSIEDLERRHVYLELNLENDEKLPPLHMVSSFNIPLVSTDRSLSPRSISIISTSLLGLQTLNITIGGTRKMHEGFQAVLRQDMASALKAFPKSITSMVLILPPVTPYGRYNQPHILPFEAEGVDSLSRALGLFSQREGLFSFTVHGCVAASILSPKLALESSPWVNLRNFSLVLHGLLPYDVFSRVFDSDSDSEEDSDESASIPAEDSLSPADLKDFGLHIKPFWLAAVETIAIMPALKAFSLGVDGYPILDISWRDEQLEGGISKASLQEVIKAKIRYLEW